jgi:hypothetical protein
MSQAYLGIKFNRSGIRIASGYALAVIIFNGATIELGDVK